MNEKPKPIFDKRIFCDVNFDLIDYEANSNWVIERVFPEGMLKIYDNAAGIMAIK